jgi:hypothetical protein
MHTVVLGRPEQEALDNPRTQTTSPRATGTMLRVRTQSTPRDGTEEGTTVPPDHTSLGTLSPHDSLHPVATTSVESCLTSPTESTSSTTVHGALKTPWHAILSITKRIVACWTLYGTTSNSRWIKCQNTFRSFDPTSEESKLGGGPPSGMFDVPSTL